MTYVYLLYIRDNKGVWDVAGVYVSNDAALTAAPSDGTKWNITEHPVLSS